MTSPSLAELWGQANGDRAEYRRLLHEHGLLIARGEAGHEQAGRKLPCGWEPGKTRAQQDRCEVTDLLRDSCGHCTGRTGEPELSELDPRQFGPWFPARYDGECDGCGSEFQAGDSIRSDGAGGWLCGECGEAAQ